MAHCLICEAHIEPFMSFGKTPIANGFVRPEEFGAETFFDLQVGFCARCHMVQLTELVDPSKLFHEEYAYHSSISTHMQNHFREFAEGVRREHLTGPDPFVVEIGSNDGIMLQHFARGGVRHLGVEPSANVARVAIEKGVNTVCRFFDEQAAADIRREHGPADAFLGANVFCHLPDIHSVIRGIGVLLKEDGVAVFEDPYLGDIIEKTSYDQIYDEHVFYFSLHSMSHLFGMHGMEVVDVAPQGVHGGSMRYTVARRGAHAVRPAVGQLLERERALGLTDPHTYELFRERVHHSRDELRRLLSSLKREGRRVVGYGATSKSTTVINFCGLDGDLIDFISDTTPGKQGKFSPGAHIPVVPYERFKESPPDYALLFAWNHGREIMNKEEDFRRRGGKFIVYVPAVQTL